MRQKKWRHTYSIDSEKNQTELCRYYLGVNSSVNKCMVLGECGRVSLSYIYGTKCIKCVVCMDKSRC